MNCYIFPPLFSVLVIGNIDSNKSSITNGICCSTNTKYTKPGRKNSNLSQQDSDKKPLNNNNISNNTEQHFDGIDEIISAVNTGTIKPKKSSNQSKSKDRKKLHGSLPNHLDTDVDYEGSDDTNSSGKWISSNFPSVVLSSLSP